MYVSLINLSQAWQLVDPRGYCAGRRSILSHFRLLHCKLDLLCVCRLRGLDALRQMHQLLLLAFKILFYLIPHGHGVLGVLFERLLLRWLNRRGTLHHRHYNLSIGQQLCARWKRAWWKLHNRSWRGRTGWYHHRLAHDVRLLVAIAWLIHGGKFFCFLLITIKWRSV